MLQVHVNLPHSVLSVTSVFHILCRCVFCILTNFHDVILHYSIITRIYLIWHLLPVLPDSYLFLDFGNVLNYSWFLVMLNHCLTGFFHETLLLLAHVFGFLFCFHFLTILFYLLMSCLFFSWPPIKVQGPCKWKKLKAEEFKEKTISPLLWKSSPPFIR